MGVIPWLFQHMWGAYKSIIARLSVSLSGWKTNRASITELEGWGNWKALTMKVMRFHRICQLVCPAAHYHPPGHRWPLWARSLQLVKNLYDLTFYLIDTIKTKEWFHIDLQAWKLVTPLTLRYVMKSCDGRCCGLVRCQGDGQLKGHLFNPSHMFLLYWTLVTVQPIIVLITALKVVSKWYLSTIFPYAIK